MYEFHQAAYGLALDCIAGAGEEEGTGGVAYNIGKHSYGHSHDPLAS